MDRPHWPLIAMLALAIALSACSPAGTKGGRVAFGGTSLIPAVSGCPVRVVQSAVSVDLFARPGSGACLPPGTLMTYRCGPRSDPVALVGSRVFLGGRFVVPAARPPPGTVHIGSGPEGIPAFVSSGRASRLVVGAGSGLDRWLALPSSGRVSSGRPSVFLLGDSIMLGSERVVGTALAGWSPTFDAVVGRSTAGGVAVVAGRGPRLADAAVVELGTNDRTPQRFALQAEELLRLVRATPVVIWVTVHGPNPPVPDVNGEIRSVASRFPNTAVADWGSAVPADGLDSDGIHPNRIGKLALAGLLQPVLDSWRAAVLGRGDRACERAARTLAAQALR
jgi:hypothetical protein